MPKPNALLMVGVCPFCQESVEFPFTKNQLKNLVKQFKGFSGSVGIKAPCSRCGKSVEMVVTKREVKRAWKGMKEESIAQADIVANIGMESKR